MRTKRFLKLVPKILPTLDKLATYFIKTNRYDEIERRPLLDEGLVAIKRTKTTKLDPKTDSYLVTRARFAMLSYVKEMREQGRQIKAEVIYYE